MIKPDEFIFSYRNSKDQCYYREKKEGLRMVKENFSVVAYYTDLEYPTGKDVTRRDVMSSHSDKEDAEQALFELHKQMDEPHYSNYYDRVCIE